MQIWNEKNIEIPEAVLERIKKDTNFYNYYRFTITQMVKEKFSRYSGHPVGTGTLMFEFNHDGHNYEVRGYRLRPCY